VSPADGRMTGRRHDDHRPGSAHARPTGQHRPDLAGRRRDDSGARHHHAADGAPRAPSDARRGAVPSGRHAQRRRDPRDRDSSWANRPGHRDRENVNHHETFTEH
jgi:hypothetical protein